MMWALAPLAFWRSDRDADVRWVAKNGPAMLDVPRTSHRALFADARRVNHGPQSSQQCEHGVITEMATGYPGYNSLVPKSCGSVGEVLKENGYNTSWFGKMHNIPDWITQPGRSVRFVARRAWISNTSMDLSVATATSGTRLSTRTQRRSNHIWAIRTTSSIVTWRIKPLPGCGCNTRWHRTNPVSNGAKLRRLCDDCDFE